MDSKKTKKDRKKTICSDLSTAVKKVVPLDILELPAASWMAYGSSLLRCTVQSKLAHA